ncbi:MAG: hypothetical protein ACI8UO_001556 [Verrucomicrobiales bacterium]|jgi:hypothetical protein
MNKLIRRSLFASLLGLPLYLTSCTVLAVGAIVGTAYYIQGDYVQHVSGSVRQAVSATNAVAADLNIQPTARVGDEFKAVFNGIGPDGKKVTIKILPEREGVTKIKIRVGIGDKESSRHILNAIASKMRAA